MKKFTIIIPTMWFQNQLLRPMLDEYNNCDLVKEILIINNNGKIPFILPSKVRVLNNGVNLFVNSSWNLGVRESLMGNIIIANDDIYIEGIYDVLRRVANVLEEFKTNTVVYIDFNKKHKDHFIPYGFGVFMGMHKASYVPVPNDFKVWYGDNFQYFANYTVALTDIVIRTSMQGTSSKLNLHKERRSEANAYKR